MGVKKETRRCRDCGAVLHTRSLRCPACKAAHETALREKWKEEHKVPVICKRCGEVFITVARERRPVAELCQGCRPLVAGETRASRREAQRAMRGKGRKVTKLPPAAEQQERPLRPEPTGSKDSLEHVVWELEEENRRRRGKKKPMLTYGQYVAVRTGRAKF